jgi:hypothetical protein
VNLNGTGIDEHFIPQSASGAQDPCGIAVSPTAESAPASYAFAKTVVGGASDIQAFYIADGGSSVMDVSSAGLAGANPGDFEITGDGCTGTEASAGLGCVLNVRFTPSALGNRNATIEIKSNASNSPTEVPVSGPGVEPPDAIPPKIDGASVDPPVFAVRRGGRPGGPTRSVKRGTVFRYSLSERARVTFAVERNSAGRLVGGVCVPARPGNRHRPRCTRRHSVGSFSDAGAAGANTRPYGGRVDDKPLRPAHYRATLTATDRAGNASKPVGLRFRIVRAGRRGQ